MVVPHDNQPRDPFNELLKDLPRGVGPERLGLPPAACFESPRNVVATPALRFDPQNTASKLFLGVAGGEVVRGPPLPDGRVHRWVRGGTPIGLGDDRHHLLLAGSRVGKGRSAILPILATLPTATSLLTIDPKGDLARLSARYRAEVLRQLCVVLDPFDCSGEGTRRFRGVFNPIDILVRSDRRTLVANARLIADALIVTGDFKDKHWDETAKQMLAGLCVHVATSPLYEGMRNLVTVWKLASELATPDPNDKSTAWLEREMTASDAAGGMVRAAARQFYDRTGGEFSGVLSNLRKHLDWVSYECMQDVLVGDSIDLRDLKRKNVAFYVTLPAMRMDALRGWMRLVVQMALAACEEERELVGNPCVMVLDEFHALGRMSALETAAAEIAGLGVKLLIALQGLSQLSVYEKNYETFIANAGCIQVMGCSDNTTLEYLSMRLGQTTTLTRSTNTPTFDQAATQGAKGLSWSVATHPLMTAEEIGRYFSRDDKLLRQLVIRPGYRPMVLQRAFYDKHDLLRGRLDG